MEVEIKSGSSRFMEGNFGGKIRDLEKPKHHNHNQNMNPVMEGPQRNMWE